MSTTPQRVLIIGAGFAGLECALKLANDHRFDVTLVNKTNHHLFQPLLYQVATASLSAPDVARSVRAVLAEADNVKVLQDSIESIDTDAQIATGKSDRRYPYDRLVVAAGARTGYFGNSHWAEHTIGLKTLDDAYKLRRKVLSNLEKAELCDNHAQRQRNLTIAIVGGGPTGVELSGAFIELIQRSMSRDFRSLNTENLRVILIEAAPALLPPYGAHHQKYTEDRLRKLGVEVMTNTRVKDVQDKKLILEDGVIEAGTIVWAAGIEAAPITRQLPVETDRAGKITPNLDLSLPGHPEIFVAGDLVKMKDAEDKVVPGVAPAASQMGKHIAKLLKQEAAADFNVPMSERYDLRPKFTYWDKGNMAIIGRSAAVVDAGKMQLQGFIAWCAWLFIHVLFLIGFRSKISVLIQWAWAYINDKPGARVFAGELDIKVKPEVQEPELSPAER